MINTEDRDTQVAVRLARLLQRARVRSGLTLQQVEAVTGLPKSNIHRLETGATLKAPFSDIVRLADFYRIPLDELLVQIGLREEGPPAASEPKSAEQAELDMLVEVLRQQASPDQLQYVNSFLRMFLKTMALREE